MENRSYYHTKKDDAYNKAISLINKNLDRFDSLPLIQEFDDGNMLFQYFKNWETNIDEVKNKKFIKIDNINGKSAFIFFYTKGKKISVMDNNCHKDYLVLNGNIKFNIDKKDVTLNSFNKLSITNTDEYSFEVLEDSYVILIK